MKQKILAKFFPLIFIFAALAACETAYYSTLERVGVYKRDILVSRVEKARDSQEETKQQFQSALEQFASIVELQDTELARQYKKINSEYEKSVAVATKLKERIDAVESVSEALFEEWRDELELYSNKSLRASSRKKMIATEKQYRRVIKSMRNVEKSVQPVLASFRDQVLYLKHNLNVQAISSLQNDLKSMKADVNQLIREMEKSIMESSQFIESLR